MIKGKYYYFSVEGENNRRLNLENGSIELLRKRDSGSDWVFARDKLMDVDTKHFSDEAHVLHSRLMRVYKLNNYYNG